MSFSEYLRLRLLHPGKLRRVGTRRTEETVKANRENAWCVPEGENRITRCWLVEMLRPRLPVICQRRDAVPRLPQIRITDAGLAQRLLAGTGDCRGQNQRRARPIRRAMCYSPGHCPTIKDGTNVLRGFAHAEVLVPRLRGSVSRMDNLQGCYGVG